MRGWTRDGDYCECDRPSCRWRVAWGMHEEPPPGWRVVRCTLLESWDPDFVDRRPWWAFWRGRYRRDRGTICPACAEDFARTSQGWMESRKWVSAS